MKILFKYVVLVTFVFTLSACGRMGDLTSNKSGQIDSGESTSSTY
jgi:predicted small lipoprotein YifL